MIEVTLINTLVVIVAVVIHYECLLRLNDWLPTLRAWSRFRIVVGVFGAMLAHALEVWCFALVYYLMTRSSEWGSLSGNFDGSLMDCVYFSFTTFTTIGFGDISPLGKLKYLTGLQGLTGLVLISWTASFLFLEMQKYWKSK
ncbi:potassium channel family protein [Pseudomonas sp. H3(2019)]|uniref:potassium channel family protein n=1 Tax=Pseudomonas sp. H3(2019) TaxID=2598724 RepID=UPI0011954F74|nr:potassium channel family protein [Pseudomonas sp. H3(2019)]TVT81445.1 two pore domain potassium channel family protein [Pseudomonas sp. H3(2019)]